MKGDYKIPFDAEGNMLSYAPWGGDPEWRDNKPFEATMEFLGYSRGRSSALMWFRDASNFKYPVFLSDFDKVARLMVHGTITARWVGTKRGTNYGLQLAEEA